MPDIPALSALAAVALLVVVAVLVGLVLSSLRALGAARRDETLAAEALRTDLAVMKAQGQDLERDLRQDLAIARRDHAEAALALRGEVGERLTQFTGTAQEQLKDIGARLAHFTQLTQEQLTHAAEAQAGLARMTTERLSQLREANEQRLEAVRQTVEQRLDALRSDNSQKLEQMRATVDEKLQQTLETRLGESFKLVSERLEHVHRGLGEMKELASGVGDLKRVLTNVKSRGTWGEVQLGALLAEVLTPQQYEANVATVPGSSRRVEFAIRLPGRGDEGQPCWLPVDAKFPLEDWQRLQDALERADAPAVEESRKALADFVRLSAKAIRDAYVAPPHTTDFAILFVPTEGLYAELMSRPGFAEQLQRDYRVTLTGPNNFLALLNSLQMGFRTLAIEQRSAEAWKTLGAVKSEFGKFGEVLAKAQKKLQEASNTLDEARGKTTTIVRKLTAVESLPEPEAARLLADAPPIDVAADPETPPDDK